MADDDLRPPPIGLWPLFLRFLRFGALAFGGPVAQIAMIRRELVERDRWMSSGRFNRLLAVMQALPGPEAHELCVHMGVRARGWRGGLVGGLGFMLPGFLLMLAAAWAWFRFDVGQGAFAAALLGAQAAVIGLIARAVERIGRHILVARSLWLVAALALPATLAGVPFWLVLPGGALVHGLAATGRRGAALAALGLAVAISAFWLLRPAPPSVDVVVAAAAPASVLALFLTGLKAGLLTFGGAYTAIPFVRADVVPRGWMSDGTFLDGVVLANVMPAPLVIFGTFVGYAAGGFPGALAVTAGVFLPAFAFSMVLHDRLEQVVGTPAVHAVLDGIAGAVVGVIAATVLQLAAGLAGQGPGSPLLVIGGLALVAAWTLKGRFAAPLILAVAAAAGQLWLG
ncbi:MAG: chromate transporter [Caulobacterales bacterium RIFCSPHIGHO2_01_FULL_70_19]|nr:MAG: chromate transporter [Caulobacterales bacterium RIFCSPHIGHO2_01_FULL_70_19]